MTRKTILCVGEILWDVLPAGRYIGGAPFNVAAHLARLGVASRLLSAVGDDAVGREAQAAARAAGVDTRLLQIHPRLPTGEARALLDANGAATFRIQEPAAWDEIVPNDECLTAAAQADAIVIGTLGRRGLVSRQTIDGLITSAAKCVFDANLRPPHVDPADVLRLLAVADIVKLNDDEATFLAARLDCPASHETLARELGRRFGIETVCVTRGAAGAVLMHHGQWFEQSGIPTTVADTIGAGDAFLAMLIAGLLDRVDPRQALRRATQLGSIVASRPGAVPPYSMDEMTSAPSLR